MVKVSQGLIFPLLFIVAVIVLSVRDNPNYFRYSWMGITIILYKNQIKYLILQPLKRKEIYNNLII